jgi:hypothetical protein
MVLSAKIMTSETPVQQLNVDTDYVEELLIGLILEGKVEGRIDQVGNRLELDRQFVLSSLSPPRRHNSHSLTLATAKASRNAATWL